MSTDQNKAVVRRFVADVIERGNLGAIDELVAPNYANAAMPGAGLAGFKAAMAGLSSLLQGGRCEDLTLIAEGDAVVARFMYHVTLTDGKTLSCRNHTYFRLENGKIVEDDPVMKPDVLGELAGMMTPPGRA